ncbi:MAG: AgmX/PglI C-terminal domain-containing protein [Myxococcota bacterium]|nr:AgmX/PglI C-terminal domain-containing protein [Myxococcota bacterium]
MRWVALLLVAACTSGTGVSGPRAKPVLRLVECAPAKPLFVEVDGRITSHGRLDGDGMGWAGGGRKPSVPARKAASISFGMPSTSGMMDAMIVRRAVTTRMTDLQKCYERELQVNASATRHSVAWRFAVAQDGHVVSADPTSQQMSASTNACVSRVFRMLQFPARQTAGSITVTLPLVFDSIPIADRPALLMSGEKVAWTPFAIGAFAPERGTNVARAAESALRGKSTELEACFGARANASGSLRTLLGVQGDGTVAMIRAGGIGDDTAERCVEKALGGMKVFNPLGDATEIACDFARGDAQPWRVTPSSGYGLIAATRKDMTFGNKTIAVGALEPDALPASATYLILAEPDTPGSVITNALAWASEGDASLVALRDGSRAPMYLGMGRVGHDDAIATRPMLMLARNKVQACLGRQSREGKLSEAGQLAQKLATRCKSQRCGSLVIGMDDLSLAKDLVEITGAARRAGFERVLIGGRVVCDKAVALEEEEEP